MFVNNELIGYTLSGLAILGAYGDFSGMSGSTKRTQQGSSSPTGFSDVELSQGRDVESQNTELTVISQRRPNMNPTYNWYARRFVVRPTYFKLPK